MFNSLGRKEAPQSTVAGGLTKEIEEFLAMPLDLTMVFLDMSVSLTEMILQTLEEAGVILVKGMTPM